MIAIKRNYFSISNSYLKYSSMKPYAPNKK